MSAGRGRLAELLREADPDPVELALLVAMEAQPTLRLDGQLSRVDRIAREALTLGGGVDGVVVALRVTGLQGDRTLRNDPRGSLMPDVLDRGVGLSLCLAMLTVGVARRAGVRMCGVLLPGHAVVCADHSDAPAMFDPHHGWRAISRLDCAQLASGDAELTDEDLRPVSARALTARMLADLRQAYLTVRDLRNALWTVELGRMIDPGDTELQRQRAVLLAGVGRYQDAQDAAEGYLAEHPGSPDAPLVERHLEALHDMMRRMN
ncbi:MAG: tetratricopeptide repeat protein [Thermoleophilia bacterium]